MDVVVEVGGWEHACCGSAVERDQLVDLGCIRIPEQDGEIRLMKVGHETEPEVRVRGRVRDIHVVRDDGPVERVLRLPSGQASRGSDDGHLEDPWTGELLPDGDIFLVTVHVGQRRGAAGEVRLDRRRV